jgi:hypothetical protein
MQPTINIAAEDRLGIAALERILNSEFENIQITRILPTAKLAGCAPIRARVENFRQAAESGQYFIVLTDLDTGNCPSALLQDWGVLPLPERLLFRIAVREIESWLLGDRQNIAKLLGVKLALVDPYPEQLNDPKEALLGLAKKGSKKIQKELLPEKGTFGKIGPGYNDVLCTFVGENWDYRNASTNAPSLGRFLNRIDQLNLLQPE